MKNWIKSSVKFVLYRAVELFVRPSTSITPKTLLLIRTDAIGDYILFRNFLKVLGESSKFGDYEITLVGNAAWRDIAERFDARYVSKFIWINRYQFENSLFYRHKKLSQITETGYAVLINTLFSRNYHLSDSIAKVTPASEKIAHQGDLSNISTRAKRIADGYYTTLIPAPEKVMFEFCQNRRFFEHILDESIDLKSPKMKCDISDSRFKLPADFAILFIGAGNQNRKWPIDKFVELAQKLSEKNELEIVLLGGPEDQMAASKFEAISSVQCINLVGKTSIIEYVQTLAACRLLVSNETSAPHIAQALGNIPVVVICNGFHFGRFTRMQPISNKHATALHPGFKAMRDNTTENHCADVGVDRFDISEISVSQVYELVDSVLDNS